MPYLQTQSNQIALFAHNKSPIQYNLCITKDLCNQQLPSKRGTTPLNASKSKSFDQLYVQKYLSFTTYLFNIIRYGQKGLRYP